MPFSLSLYVYIYHLSNQRHLHFGCRENKHKENGLYVLLEEDFFTLQDSAVTAGILSGLMNADNIKAHIARLIQDVKIIKKKNGDPKKLLRNYSFEGSPGTGKTTVARAFGEVFHSLGLLSSPAVVECKAMELMGQYVGHSAKNMRCVSQYTLLLLSSWQQLTSSDITTRHSSQRQDERSAWRRLVHRRGLRAQPVKERLRERYLGATSSESHGPEV